MSAEDNEGLGLTHYVGDKCPDGHAEDAVKLTPPEDDYWVRHSRRKHLAGRLAVCDGGIMHRIANS